MRILHFQAFSQFIHLINEWIFCTQICFMFGSSVLLYDDFIEEIRDGLSCIVSTWQHHRIKYIVKFEDISGYKASSGALQQGGFLGYFYLLCVDIQLVFLAQVDGCHACHYFCQRCDLSYYVSFELVYSFVVAKHTDVLGRKTS